MKTANQILTASALTCLASSSAILPREAEVLAALNAWKRATPQAPNNYAPQAGDCPSTRPSVRLASGLSDSETSWLEKRRPNTVDPMRDLLVRLNIAGFDAGAYIDSHRDNTTALPNVATAFSGGGYRAMLNGAGALAAFDSRTPNSTSAGHIGGLLQSSTYISGLSGGAWLVGSIYTNNFTSVQSIIDQPEDGSLWHLDQSILEGPRTGGIQILNTAGYYDDLYDSANSKEDAGFDTSLTDYWGRALSYQLVNATNGGPAYTFSSIQDDPEFRDANAPMPFLVANERAPGETAISLNTTNIEFNPFEMGSFDPTLYGFMPLKFLGSNFAGGELPDNERCVRGFDNVGFVMGTSSSLFNQFILQLDNVEGVPQILRDAIEAILTPLDQNENDIADYAPNPFYHFNNRTNPSAQDKTLTLVDGGEDGQNIPLIPLIQPFRAVDVIFAIDSSADTVADDGSPGWPDGTSMIATYRRSENVTMQNGTAFPSVPDQNTFINLGLNNRPTFFGCDAGNMTGTGPLIVYLPNAPYEYNSNTSTFQLEYNNTERNAIIQNGYDVATMGNGTVDAQWPTCVGCAILSRSFNRTGTTVPDACRECFDRFCWNGTLASQTPPPYNPEMKLTPINVASGAGHFMPNVVGFAIAVAVSAWLMV